MPEVRLPYRKTLPPHIRSADSLAKRYWGQVFAAAPLFVAACLTGHAEILRVLLICLVSAVAFEFLVTKVFRKKESLRNGPNTNQSKQSGTDSLSFQNEGNQCRPNFHESKENKSWGGETVLAAVLFALLMPSRCPSEVVILGVFVAVVAARELFGGIGSYLFQPLLLARVFLQITFPGLMTEPMLLTGDGSVWVLMAVGLGGLVSLKQKQGYWETPALFMAVCFLYGALSGGQAMPMTFFSTVLFTAFFLLTDPVAMPLTRRGTIFFALGAALLSSGLSPEGFSIRAAGYAVLLMNLLTPWLDLWLKPASYKTKEKLKATYPS